jgi:putative aldouronate transport system substrate-binding protein
MHAFNFKTAASLAAIMLLCAACFGGGSKDKERESTPEPGMDGPVTPYKEPVRMMVWSGVNDIMGFAEGESIEDHLHTRYMKQALNIEFANKWVADGNKIGEKVNLDIASNQLPDAVQVTLDQLHRMMRNDQLADLTEVWNRYATDGLKNNMGYQDGIAFKPAEKQGRIYGIPLTYDMGNSIAMMYIRTDWLAELGLDIPRTIEELSKVAIAFTRGDPDRNGKADTYGIAFDQGAAGNEAGLPGGMAFDAIAAAYGIYPGHWIEQEGEGLIYDSVNPRMRDVLSILQEWYKQGVIDPEFAVKDLSRVGQDIQNGKVGIVFGPFHYPLWPLKGSLEKNAEADWLVEPIPTLDGSKPRPKAQPFVGNWVVVRKDYGHPEALIKALNITYMMQAGIGEPGKFWEEAGKGVYRELSPHLYMKPYPFDSPIRNLSIGKQIKDAIDQKDESLLTMPAAKQQYENNIKSEDRLTSWAFRKVFYDAEKVLASYGSLQYSAFFDAPTPQMQDKGAALAKMEYDAFTQIIMGSSLSEFDRFVQQWSQLGGRAIQEEVNMWQAGKEEAP